MLFRSVADSKSVAGFVDELQKRDAHIKSDEGWNGCKPRRVEIAQAALDDEYGKRGTKGDQDSPEEPPGKKRSGHTRGGIKEAGWIEQPDADEKHAGQAAREAKNLVPYPGL